MSHVENVVERRITNDVWEVLVTEKEQMTGMWRRWLDDEWYSELVHYNPF